MAGTIAKSDITILDRGKSLNNSYMIQFDVDPPAPSGTLVLYSSVIRAFISLGDGPVMGLDFMQKAFEKTSKQRPSTSIYAHDVCN